MKDAALQAWMNEVTHLLCCQPHASREQKESLVKALDHCAKARRAGESAAAQQPAPPFKEAAGIPGGPARLSQFDLWRAFNAGFTAAQK
jgi:hypothetical protein